MTLQVVPDDDAPLSPEDAATVVRLADEGIPVRAIARSIKRNADVVREAISYAIADGRIIEMPRDDWPPGVKRDSRMQSGFGALNEETLLHAVMMIYKITRTEARVLVPLLQRNLVVTKQQLHQSIENGRPDADACEIKMVDVIICKLRKKIAKHNIEIKTVWSEGYTMTPEHRSAAFQAVTAFISQRTGDVMEQAA